MSRRTCGSFVTLLKIVPQAAALRHDRCAATMQARRQHLGTATPPAARGMQCLCLKLRLLSRPSGC